MKTIQLLTLLFCIAIGCTKSTTTTTTITITNPSDYTKYLQIDSNKMLEQAQKEAQFWSDKLEKNPNQYPYNVKLAAANNQLFHISGDIKQLKAAENNLLTANTKTNYNNAGYLRSLARNYISQHRFKEALALLEKAEKNGEKRQLTQFMLTDVHLELGNTQQASNYLSNVKNFKSFDYLIRISKFSDALGNLESAISYLEDALRIIEKSNKTDLLEWNYTNLGDYYGHAGRLQDAYQAYLKALAINPTNSYAKKGIAWIVFSHEKNAPAALQILEAIAAENSTPDLHLFMAEIADFTGNIAEKEAQIDQYFNKVSDKDYGAMYAKYNVLLLAEDISKSDTAIAIAKQEVQERPTPQSYDLLAWSYYKNGFLKKALSISKEFVINNTYEPEALLHTAQILKANKQVKEAQKLKEMLLESTFELGPNASKKLEQI